MKKFFDIKRTKMTDDAAFRHTPTTAGKTVLMFILVYIIASLISSIIPAIADSVYNLILASRSGLFDAYAEAARNGDSAQVEAIINELLESIKTPSWLIIVELFAKALVAGSAIFYCLKMEKRPFKSLGLRGGKSAIGECALGLGIGLFISLMVAGFSFATTSISFAYSGAFNWIFYLLIPACFVSALSEEILWRGYLMTSLARDTTPIRAILITSIAYAVLHISLNPILILNAFLFAFFMGVYVFKHGSIWGATLINFVWTFSSAVVFGSYLPIVGEAPSILKPVFLRMDFISGGEFFGFFAGLSFTLVILLATAILLLTKTKKKEISSFTIDYFA